MKKFVKPFHKGLYMKAFIFDELGRRIFKSEGDVKKVLKESWHFGKFALSVVDRSDLEEADKDIMSNFDFLGFDKAKKERDLKREMIG